MGDTKNSVGRPTFSGHETFPLRTGWLKKAFDAVACRETVDAARFFREPEAMAEFGVGKNMVIAIRHWALATGVIQEGSRDTLEPTPFGYAIFGEDGRDPFLEYPDSLWRLHWRLAGRGMASRDGVRAAMWYIAFSYLNADPFKIDDLLSAASFAAEQLGWSLPGELTLDRDAKCLLRCYTSADRSEDGFGSPLISLRLITPSSERDWFHFVRGPKPSLSSACLWEMITDFWGASSSPESIAIEDVISGIGSPGRVLKLDRETIWSLLPKVHDLSHGEIIVADLGGRAQLQRIVGRSRGVPTVKSAKPAGRRKVVA